MNILTVIGNNVRYLRKKMGISQEELGDAAGLDRTYIGGIERGERNVSALNIAKLAKALKVKPERLLVEKLE
jgi:transcriptional regulator with XRE-family HTH domain